MEKKTAEQVLLQHACLSLETQNHVLQAMEAYAEQFKLKWVAGESKDMEKVLLLFSNGLIGFGYRKQSRWWNSEGTTYNSMSVIAFCEIALIKISDNIYAKIQ